MKLIKFLVFGAAICTVISCKELPRNEKLISKNAINTNSIKYEENKSFDTDFTALVKDFDTWYSYTYYNVILSSDFIGLDEDLKEIDKKIFLEKLVQGNVVAYKTKILQGKSVYQLFKLKTNEASIKNTSAQMAATALEHFMMEGKEISDFYFKDLEGKIYTKENTKGKTLVLKCWFIHCVTCVGEFPALNKMVEKYNNNSNVLFVSLAMDSKAELSKFLQTKEFKYATIPEMKNFMVDKLRITQYPTHLLIDKNSKIIKVVNKMEELEPFLEKQMK